MRRKVLMDRIELERLFIFEVIEYLQYIQLEQLNLTNSRHFLANPIDSALGTLTLTLLSLDRNRLVSPSPM